MPVLANIHSILAYDVLCTENVGLPTKFRFNAGPALQPIAVPMPVYDYYGLRRWPNTNPPTFAQHCSNVIQMFCICWESITGSIVYLAQTRGIQPNAVSMLTHSFRHWTVIYRLFLTAAL